MTGTHRHYKTAAGEPNLAPRVEAGPDVTSRSLTHTLRGSVIDDGKPGGELAISWSQVSGPGSGSFEERSNPTTGVKFETTGIYTLKLSASDGLVASSAEVTSEEGRVSTFTVSGDQPVTVVGGTQSRGTHPK